MAVQVLDLAPLAELTQAVLKILVADARHAWVDEGVGVLAAVV